jgi:hypothetical protein
MTEPIVVSPLPTGLELDEAIERKLGQWDSVPFEVRRVSGVIALQAQQLAPARVLQLLGHLHLLLSNDRG